MLIPSNINSSDRTARLAENRGRENSTHAPHHSPGANHQSCYHDGFDDQHDAHRVRSYGPRYAEQER
jgi:hypothetical protein